MPQEILLTLSPQEAADFKTIEKLAARRARIETARLQEVRITKKSIDARGRNIKVLITADCYLKDESLKPVCEEFKFKQVNDRSPVIIIGSGPAGLFAALELLEQGVKPVVLERGKPVEERRKDIEELEQNKPLNPESNYCYGEGGAGTFSDGKLNTRSKKKGNRRKVLELLYRHGAHESILYDAHPHIGSDRLPEIIAAMRRTIIEHGGEVHFNSRVTDFELSGNHIRKVITENGHAFEGKAYILATGHSAHDIYFRLHHSGITLQPKAFAVGVRVEHPQALINEIQYGKEAKSGYLPNASYQLVKQIDDRGVYSFCMCPGGQIVPSSTVENALVVNGMSNAARNSPFANSGIVVQVKEEDMPGNPEDPLRGLKMQQNLEAQAFNQVCNGSSAPGQRLIDFVNNKTSQNLPSHSYLPGLQSSDMHNWLPPHIKTRLQKGFDFFNRKMRGYLTSDAIIAGVESRSSSPVRIPRNPETLQHIEIDNLYPSGEGAGYAGGIVSSAVDGMRCAAAVAESGKL